MDTISRNSIEVEVDFLVYVFVFKFILVLYLIRKYYFNRLALKRILYDNLLEKIDDTVFVKDKNLNYVQINLAFKSVYNLLDIRQFNDEYIFDKETAEEYKRIDNEILKSGTPVTNFEFYEKYQTGGGRWVIINRYPVTSFKKVIGITGISKDISYQKKMEKKYKKSLEFSQQVIDSIPIPIFYKDENLRYQGVNKAYCEFFKRKPEDILNKTAAAFLPEDVAKGVHKYDTKVLEEGLVEFELELKRDNGETVWFQDCKKVVHFDSGRVIIGALLEVTERKMREKANEDNLKFLQKIIDAVPTPIFYKNESLVYTGCNKEFSNYIGLPESEVIGKTDDELYDVAHADSFSRMDKALIANGGIQIFESKLKYSEGDIRDVILYKHIFTEPATGKRGIVGTMMDISDMKEVEHRLIESEARIRSIYENLPLGIYRANPNGKFEMANPAIFDILGFDRDKGLDAFNFEYSDYVDPDARSKFFDIITKEGKIQGFENKWRKKDGKLIWIRESSTAHKDDNGTLVFYEGTVEDITEQKQMEKILRESEDKYRSLIENSADAIFLIDGNKLKAFNLRFAELFGISEYERNEIDILADMKDNSSLNILLDKIREFMLVQTNNLQVEFKIEPVIGNELYLDAHLNRLEKKSVQGVIRDVSEKQKMAMRIRQMQKMEAIGTLAAGIAHEINTPTQYINDNLHFLNDTFENIVSVLQQLEFGEGNETYIQLKNLPIGVNEEEIEFMSEEIPLALEQSLDGTKRIKKIVSAMKEFAHQSKKERVAADLHKMIKNTITVSKNEWKYFADVETQFDAELPLVECDPDQLKQVFLNLIVNSAHAIEEKVEKTNEKGKINIATFRKKDEVVISITDTGCGIPEEIKNRIFDPFFTTKQVGKGSGQGLAIVYSIIVEQHHGNIDFSSVQGEGTEFLISLPLAEKG